MSLRFHGMTAVVIALLVCGGPVRAYGSMRGGMGYARQMYQQQMKEQAAMQKMMYEMEQKQLAAEAAEEKRQHEMHLKAVRARTEKEKSRKEDIIAKRKADAATKPPTTSTAKPAAAEPASKPVATTKD